MRIQSSQSDDSDPIEHFIAKIGVKVVDRFPSPIRDPLSWWNPVSNPPIVRRRFRNPHLGPEPTIPSARRRPLPVPFISEPAPSISASFPRPSSHTNHRIIQYQLINNCIPIKPAPSSIKLNQFQPSSRPTCPIKTSKSVVLKRRHWFQFEFEFFAMQNAMAAEALQGGPPTLTVQI